MRSRLFHAIVVSSASFAGGCSTDPITLPSDAGFQGSNETTPHDMGMFGGDLSQGVDAGLQCCHGDMAIIDMGLAVGVAPIDSFGPPPDIQKAFDGGVVPADMGMTVIYDMIGQKDLP